ncbi:MAG TPA: PEP/pyruvate-binding domain-containing protein [Anaerolineales bacterium]|nr:PEP/pyruvate-binding domain-containing protein [Anaerolineales bacterium]
MEPVYVLSLVDSHANLETAGGKGASLARLAAHGLPVPDGFHVTTAAYKRFVAENNLAPGIDSALKAVNISQPATLETASQAIHDRFAQANIPEEVAGAIARAYGRLPGNQPAVAVRSSATAEDLPDLSFAGQQETYLNIDTPAEVLEAVKRCWASLWTARAIGYRERNKIDHQAVSLAVVVQLLVPAEAAGILFTINPLNGRRDQALINAAWGLGEAVVGGAVNPDTVVMDNASGQVIERQTADKRVMTVRVDGATQEQPVPPELRRAPVLDDSAATELFRLGVQIEQIYAMPMDIEWALADGKFAILQARPVTALPEPEESITIEWKPPDPKGQYLRMSAVDLMPDPLSPLFTSIGLPALISGVNKLGRRLTRSEPVLPKDYFTTINSYAYGNATLTPRGWWWALTGLLPAYPRLLRVMVPFWRDEARPQYQAAIARWQDKQIDRLPPAALWQEAQEVLDAAMYYLGTLLFATMGASAGSEGLLTRVYDKMVKREGDPPATTLVMGYNSIPVQAEKSLYDLAMWCGEHTELTAYFLATPSAQIMDQLRGMQPPGGISEHDWQALSDRFEGHLKRFGHTIYELDFAKPLPLDDPTPMLETCKMYLRGEGSNPHERQHLSEEKRKQTTQTMLGRLKGLRLWAFRKALNWGQSMAEVREDALADIGLGFPLLRQMLRELGRRFVAAGAIHQPEDIFWLVREEIETGVAELEQGRGLDNLTERVEQRKAFWRAAKRATPPPVLPPKERIMGIKAELFTAVSESSQTGDVIKGVATSAGKVTAPACVLHGPEDFDLMKPGAVLVAGTTTPAWTPLFAMASAIVTDIGGPLSHGSIVAREYGIPAVMGTGVATRRIRNGQLVTVDGSAGNVTLLKNDA